MNIRIIMTVFCMSFSLMASAQASGGQIKRSSRGAKVVSKSSSHTGQRQQKKYAPIDMEPNTFYMCINETWVEKNGQELCRKMAAKGYDAELIKDPDPSMGYHVSVYKTKDKDSAIVFYNNFEDERWGIAYPFYDRKYLPDFLAFINDDNNLYNELRHKEVMKVVVSSARINDSDITQKTVELKQSIILYTVSGEDLYMANITEKTNTQSWGSLTITNSQEQPETDKLYKKLILSCIWNYHNTYDNNTGKCPVTIETVFTPDLPFTTVTISVNESYVLTYSGNSSFYAN